MNFLNLFNKKRCCCCCPKMHCPYCSYYNQMNTCNCNAENEKCDVCPNNMCPQNSCYPCNCGKDEKY